MKLVKILSAAALGVSMAVGSIAQAETTIRVQSVLGDSSDEVVMLKEFAKDVGELTGGSLTIEVLPAGAVVSPSDIIDAVDAGLVEAGFAWTHYWGGKHVAANLFGAPVAGAGVGMDNIAFLSWFQFGGGKELYDRLWDEMGVNVKGFMLQPVGPEALGWFPTARCVSVRLREWLVLLTLTLVFQLLQWAAATSCQRLKRAQLTQRNGAARSLTLSLVFRKF